MSKVDDLRKRVDDIDLKIIDLLSLRMRLAVSIGKLKKVRGIGIEDRGRESLVLLKLAKRAKKIGLDMKLVKKIWGEIFQVSKEAQK